MSTPPLPRPLTAYDRVVQRVAREINPLPPGRVLRYLAWVLPRIWADEYLASLGGPGALCTVTFCDQSRPKAKGMRADPNRADPFVSVLFDHAASVQGSRHDDRVVAVWGLSRREPACTREKARMADYMRGVWSNTYPGDDRGHFFAHTMGGGLDINLFPQLASVNRNRGGLWRKLEMEAAEHPGTFCFIRPIYAGLRWRPSRIEYGLIRLPPRPFGFEGYVFPN
jgi:hypothetical protein